MADTTGKEDNVYKGPQKCQCCSAKTSYMRRGLTGGRSVGKTQHCSWEITLGQSIVNKETNRKVQRILQAVCHDIPSQTDVPESSDIWMTEIREELGPELKLKWFWEPGPLILTSHSAFGGKAFICGESGKTHGHVLSEGRKCREEAESWEPSWPTAWVTCLPASSLIKNYFSDKNEAHH